MSHAVYRENFKTNEVTLVKVCENYSHAKKNLFKIIKNYIEKTYKSVNTQFVESSDEISGNSGSHFLILDKKYPNRVHLFTKETQISQGYLWNGVNHDIKETEWFGIMELQPPTVVYSNMVDELKESIEIFQKKVTVDENGEFSSLVSKQPSDFRSDFTKELQSYVENKTKNE